MSLRPLPWPQEYALHAAQREACPQLRLHLTKYSRSHVVGGAATELGAVLHPVIQRSIAPRFIYSLKEQR